MLRVSSWVVVAVAVFLAIPAFADGRVLPGVLWSGLALSNILTATGLNRRSPGLRRLEQVLSMLVLALALVYLYTILAA